VPLAETARAADASQGAYFRAALACERETVNADLAAALRVLTEGNQVLGLGGMARARSNVRELENEVRELDRLISALDLRFSARWSADPPSSSSGRLE